MQQAQFSSYPTYDGYPARSPPGLKHKLQDEQDEAPVAGPSNHGLQYTQAGSSRGGVKFSEDNLQSINSAVNATKRRKGNTGRVTLPIDLEPSFGGLSLGGTKERAAPNSFSTTSTNDTQEAHTSRFVEQPSALPRFHSPDADSTSGSLRGRRGDRDVTPFPFDASANSPHRKRSSSRNRARLGLRAASPDEEMKAAFPTRYDPSRPHVIYIDSLSDSEDERNSGTHSVSYSDDDEDGEFSTTTSPDDGGSHMSTPSNSPSSSDVEDGTVLSPSGSRRPIQLNKRLRDHLRKQAMLTRLGQKPLIDEVLASSPAITGGLGVQERGLVLYRPLSWGIVEEPDEEGTSDETFSNAPTVGIHDVTVQELPTSDTTSSGSQSSMPAEDSQSFVSVFSTDHLNGDEEMEIDD